MPGIDLKIDLKTLRSILVKTYFTSRSSILILGAPGLGKSSTVLQVAEIIADLLNRKLVVYDDSLEIDPARDFVFVDIRLTEVEASDLIGVPRTRDGYVAYMPLKWAKVMATTPGIIFLDEITNVQDDTVLAASYKILLDRRVGFVKLYDGVMVVAAGNRPEESSIARELPAPQINRTMVLTLDYDNKMDTVSAWLQYLEKRIRGMPVWNDAELEEYRKVVEIVSEWRKRKQPGKLYAIMSAFLATTKKLVTREIQSATMQNFATPRTWEMLYWTLTDEYDRIWKPEEMRAICYGLLGPSIGEMFYEWLMRPLPNIVEIINDPSVLEKMRFDDIIIATALLGIWLRSEIDTLRANPELASKVDKTIAKIRDLAGNEAIIVMLACLGTEKVTAFRRSLQLVAILPTLRKIIKEIGKVMG